MPKAGDRVFIVGGASGIGLALSQAAHALGSKLTLTSRDASHAAASAASIGPDVTGLSLDLLDPASIGSAFGGDEPIDHLALVPVYGGDISMRAFDRFEAAKAAQLKVLGYLEAIHAALPRMKPSSSIVLFGGAAKARPYPGSTMISIVNAGLVGMARTLAVELAPIRVNLISPGLVGDSPRWVKRAAAAPQVAQMLEGVKARVPARRVPEMADIAHAVFFLMDNRAVNGIDLEIDAGGLLV